MRLRGQTFIAVLLLLSIASCSHPPTLQEVRIDRPDGSSQPALFFPAKNPGGPAMVYLHSWSNDYRSKPSAKMAQEAHSRGFSFLAPNFRGPNDNPNAAGSCVALLDIALARDWLARKERPSSIVLFGESGGGHAVLLATAAWPNAFDAASAWVPVVDLQAWHAFLADHQSYAKFSRNIESIAGGITEDSPRFSTKLAKRSPLLHLTRVRSNLLIGLGARDGVEGSIPVSQGLSMYNALATKEHQLKQLPGVDFSALPTNKLLVARTSGTVQVAVFDFAHKSDVPYAFEYFQRSTENDQTERSASEMTERITPPWCAS